MTKRTTIPPHSSSFRSSHPPRPVWTLLFSFAVIGVLYIVIVQEERVEVSHTLRLPAAEHHASSISSTIKEEEEEPWKGDDFIFSATSNNDDDIDNVTTMYSISTDHAAITEAEAELLDDDEDDDGYSESESSHDEDEDDGRPPLNALIKDLDKGIIGPVDWLLDFAVLGHSKCGTTETLHWLGGHKDVVMYDYELHSLGQGHPAELVKYLYELPKGDFLRGYKSPHELQRQNSVRFLRKYWPKTKIIVGLRHPVLWFGSYYNFNYRMGNKLPPAETFVGKHFPGGVMYHEHLFRLGKTNTTDPTEYRMVGRTEPEVMSTMPNPIFLYEVSQPFDLNLTKRQIYAKDMTEFLNLSSALPALNTRKGDTSSGNYNFKIDICRPQYKALRQELTHMGNNAADWLRTYFLVLPDVKVSSPERFDELLSTWSLDPCEVDLPHVR
jgi:hypothetical protein